MTDRWLDMELPLERSLLLEQHRRAAARLHPEELRAVHDSMVVSYCHLEHMFDQAMRRIAELEVREALTLTSEHLQMGRELLTPPPGKSPDAQTS